MTKVELSVQRYSPIHTGRELIIQSELKPEASMKTILSAVLLIFMAHNSLGMFEEDLAAAKKDNSTNNTRWMKMTPEMQRNDMDQKKDCQNGFLCTYAKGWAEGMQDFFSSSEFSKEEKASQIRTLVWLSVTSEDKGLVKRNFGEVLQKSFDKLIPELDQYSDRQKEIILRAYSDWIRSKSAGCKKGVLCPPVAHFLRNLPESFDCKSFQLVRKTVVDKMSSVDHQDYSLSDRLLGGDDLSQTNFDELKKQLDKRTFGFCSETPMPSKSNSPGQNRDAVQ